MDKRVSTATKPIKVPGPEHPITIEPNPNRVVISVAGRVVWGYPDGVFASDYDIVSDTSKARRFGFHDLVDTEEMFLRMFADFRRDRIIP